jgi:hypothetical protein
LFYVGVQRYSWKKKNRKNTDFGEDEENASRSIDMELPYGHRDTLVNKKTCVLAEPTVWPVDQCGGLPQTIGLVRT